MAGRRNGAPALLAIVYRVSPVPFRTRGGVITEGVRYEVSKETVPYSWGKFTCPGGCYISRKLAKSAIGEMVNKETVIREVNSWSEIQRIVEDKRTACRARYEQKDKSENQRLRAEAREFRLGIQERLRAERRLQREIKLANRISQANGRRLATSGSPLESKDSLTVDQLHMIT